MYRKENVRYAKVKIPCCDVTNSPVDITAQTMEERMKKVLKSMRDKKFDVLAVYADREHGANFGYLTGFEPRFEEAVLCIFKDGTASILLGNEMLHMYEHCRIPVKPIHVPYFSLPNQPMENQKGLRNLFEDAGLKEGLCVGIAGWKIFTSSYEDNKQLFEVPEFIVRTINEIVGEHGRIENATDIFQSPAYGVRATVNANEAANLEYGACLSSKSMLNMLNHLEIGETEQQMASYLECFGQPHTVQTICAAGERFVNAIVSPRTKVIKKGDKFSASVGYRGGFTNRCGYVVHDESELPENIKDYLDKVAKPYYAAAASWYEAMRVGVTGGEIYELISKVLPKEEYGWTLNPGHLIGTEEWMSSSIYPGSDIRFCSGMMFQLDIIVKVPGYGGSNAEDGILLADKKLREEIAKNYPEMWKRVQRRRNYMKEELGIILHEDVLPISDSEGYLRPFLLNKEYALRIDWEEFVS